MATTRRSLLLGLGGLSALLAGGGVALFLRPGARPAVPLPKGLVFSADEMAVLFALASGLTPHAPPMPDLRVEVATAVDAVAAGMHPADQDELKQALFLFENALLATLLGGRTRPFSTLDPEAADLALMGFRDSPVEQVRVAFRALRGLLCGAWGTMRAIEGPVGYPGPPDFGQRCALDPWTDTPPPADCPPPASTEVSPTEVPPTEAPPTAPEVRP